MNYQKKTNCLTGAVYALVCLPTLFFSCTHFEKNHSHQNTPNANIARGKELAAVYCQSCHMLPDPSLLNAASWEKGVLPAMGPRLGIFNQGFTQYPSSRYDPLVDSNFYPKLPVLSFENWQYIIDYYTSVSPDSLPALQRKHPVTASTDLFSIEMPLKNKLPATSFIKVDTSVSPRRLWVADVFSKKVFLFNDHLLATDSVKVVSPVTDIATLGQQLIACNIGIMSPNNGKNGAATAITIGSKSGMRSDSNLLFSHLARPVQVSPADFNNDGKTDYLVCEFGNLTGALSWMENTGSGEYTRHVIRAFPGAIKAYIEDVNHDGLPDIWALFAQGEEGIFLFTNKGNGQFEQEQLLRFPSVYGSSYFELADFNKDGRQDILYTCGDNADYSPVLKPYHGIYIFLNDGHNHFTQAAFFAMHGCFKAMARDFNNDGNLDIAAISFFADYAHHPEESFLYLENKGGLDFQACTVPGTGNGRWLTMDAADIDKDGKIDIVLGNFAAAPANTPLVETWQQGAPFMVLKNKMNKH